MEGESLLRRTARLALEAGCAPVFVVLGFEAERMRAELQGVDATALIERAVAGGHGLVTAARHGGGVRDGDASRRTCCCWCAISRN